jgi:uncharacterized protein (DUF4213/DUF364 family)
MNLINDLLVDLPDGKTEDIRMGAFWTAVVVKVSGRQQCGLASTLRQEGHHHSGGNAMQNSGTLLDYSARQLAELAASPRVMERSVGLAAINALLPRLEDRWQDINAADIIARHGAGKQVAIVGHFPFTPRLREQVGNLQVLEQRPQGEDLPAEAAQSVIPQADIVAITGNTLLNHTFEELLALCSPNALVMVLGPSTPVSPVLFDYGVLLVSGTIVENIPGVLRAVCQGGNFRQVKQQGTRLVTIQK